MTSQWARWRLKSPASRMFTQLLFRRTSKKTSKLRVTCLCERNSPRTGVFPAQRASNAENVSIWWRQHVAFQIFIIALFWAVSSILSVTADLWRHIAVSCAFHLHIVLCHMHTFNGLNLRSWFHILFPCTIANLLLVATILLSSSLSLLLWLSLPSLLSSLLFSYHYLYHCCHHFHRFVIIIIIIIIFFSSSLSSWLWILLSLRLSLSLSLWFLLPLLSLSSLLFSYHYCNCHHLSSSLLPLLLSSLL